MASVAGVAAMPGDHYALLRCGSRLFQEELRLLRALDDDTSKVGAYGGYRCVRRGIRREHGKRGNDG